MSCWAIAIRLPLSAHIYAIKSEAERKGGMRVRLPEEERWGEMESGGRRKKNGEQRDSIDKERKLNGGNKTRLWTRGHTETRRVKRGSIEMRFGTVEIRCECV